MACALAWLSLGCEGPRAEGAPARASEGAGSGTQAAEARSAELAREAEALRRQGDALRKKLEEEQKRLDALRAGLDDEPARPDASASAKPTSSAGAGAAPPPPRLGPRCNCQKGDPLCDCH